MNISRKVEMARSMVEFIARGDGDYDEKLAAIDEIHAFGIAALIEVKKEQEERELTAANT